MLVQLPLVPLGGTTTVTGTLFIGIGTQVNNGLGSATVFNTDANAYFTTIYNGQTNSCSYIDSGSNALLCAKLRQPVVSDLQLYQRWERILLPGEPPEPECDEFERA